MTWENKVHLDFLLSRQHCQKLSQSNRVCKDYSKSKVGRSLRHSVDPGQFIDNTSPQRFDSVGGRQEGIRSVKRVPAIPRNSLLGTSSELD